MALGKHAYQWYLKIWGNKTITVIRCIFNAFTEDLFFWDNDLVNDTDRVLVLNDSSTFFAGIWELELDNRIRPLLQKYVDFDFRITQEKHRKEADKEEIERWEVSFFLPDNS